eukprot:jgi/Chlat1/5599/Chrsp369S05373
MASASAVSAQSAYGVSIAAPAAACATTARTASRSVKQAPFAAGQACVPRSSFAGASLSASTCRNAGSRAVQPLVVTAVATPSTQVDYEQMAAELENASPLQIMDRALSMFGDDIAIAFRQVQCLTLGAEDVVLIEYARMTRKPFRVFSLDTGRLNPETYRLFDEVEKKYNIHIEYCFPDAAETEAMVRAKGMFSFYEDGHQECCGIRKVRPLRKQLRTLKAWITGQRKDQSPGTRAAVPVVQVDPAFEGVDGGKGSLIKFNPLANVSSMDVWNFIRIMEVPYNKLHEQGYVSIGCEPCTKAVLPGQHEREGRWWWEEATQKECGLHKGNIDKPDGASATASAASSEADLWTDGAVKEMSYEDVSQLVNGGDRKENTMVVLYAPWCQFCQAMESAYATVAKTLSKTGQAVGKFRADGEVKEWAIKNLGLTTFPTIVMFPKSSSSYVTYATDRRDEQSLVAFVNAVESR